MCMLSTVGKYLIVPCVHIKIIGTLEKHDVVLCKLISHITSRVTSKWCKLEINFLNLLCVKQQAPLSVLSKYNSTFLPHEYAALLINHQNQST